MKFGQFLLIFTQISSIFSLIHFDLTHTIKSTNPIFPGLLPFNFTQTISIWEPDEFNQTYFKTLNTFITSEHFGTHIDAPYHGSNTSWKVDQIPFERLVSIQALIVDVSRKSGKTSNYQITIKDLNENILKEANGYFVLLFYTGKSRFWPDQIGYAGSFTREGLDFPGLSIELASHLVSKYSKQLVGVGIDTLSIDVGSSKHFHVHRILFKENIYVLENVAELDRVIKQLGKRRQTYFSFDVLPMKIEGATGAPCRLIARIDNFEDRSGGWFGFLIFFLLAASIGIGVKAVYDLKFNPNKNFA